MDQAQPAPTVRAMLLDVLVVLVCFLLAGVLAGFLWPHLVAPVRMTRTSQGLSTGEVALSNRFDADGWYSVLAGVGGLLLGVVLVAWRRAHEVVTLLVVVAGAFLAAWISAVLGTALGPADPRKALAGAKIGATALDQVTVAAHAAYLVWPIAAVVGALMVLLSHSGKERART